MTEEEIFNALFSGGNFSLPFLIKFHCDGVGTIRLVNNNESISYLGEVYATGTFSYTRPDNEGNGAKLSITGIDNQLVEFVELSNDRWSLDVVGVLAKTGIVEPINVWKHFHGSVSYGMDMKLEFSLETDDRLNMQFCAYKFDTDNNRGNA